VTADYANRQWAGLVGTFYLTRWQTWLCALDAALASGRPVDVDGVRARIRDGELAWTRTHNVYSAEPRGDTIRISSELYYDYSADASDKKLGLPGNWGKL
jgi:alpha-N-acetylglucosaminidase